MTINLLLINIQFGIFMNITASSYLIQKYHDQIIIFCIVIIIIIFYMTTFITLLSIELSYYCCVSLPGRIWWKRRQKVFCCRNSYWSKGNSTIWHWQVAIIFEVKNCVSKLWIPITQPKGTLWIFSTPNHTRKKLYKCHC